MSQEDVFATWQVALVAAAYGLGGWALRLATIAGPRDWLLAAIRQLRIRIAVEETWRGKSELDEDLKELHGRLDKQIFRVPSSLVQAGWRRVHRIEDDHILDLDENRVKAQLISARSLLKNIENPQAEELARSLEGLLGDSWLDDGPRDSVPESPERISSQGGSLHEDRGKRSPFDLGKAQALLRQAEIFRHFYNDSNFEDLAGLLGKALWLIAIGLGLIVALSHAADREVLFLLGAAGGLTSRLTRVLRQRPGAQDYGAAWSTLLMSPVAGALAGWIGVLAVSALGGTAINIFDESVSTRVWTTPQIPLALMLAFLFGFSERLFDRLLATAEERYSPGDDRKDDQRAPESPRRRTRQAKKRTT